MGPLLYLLKPGEAADALANLGIELWVNAELRQSATSAQLIFGPAETLGQLSHIIDLKPGDVVLTGTPGGVTAPASPKLVEILKTHLMADGVRRDELRAEMSKGRPFLGPGDVVTARLTDLRQARGLGGLANIVAAP
jgi:2-keto-4-pentenoate hydratase/2-oxohepta-3-ene-1,7-dioic acid hydratase in catechol pathway